MTLTSRILIIACVLLSLLAAALLHALFLTRRKLSAALAGLNKCNESVNRKLAAESTYYDDILEADLTHDTLIGQNSSRLLTRLSLPPDTGYSKCIEALLQKFVKPEFSEMYREGYSRENLLKKYDAGDYNFTMEFIERADLVHYKWTRTHVCIYNEAKSNSVNIVSYVKQIQDEKQYEYQLQQIAETDLLTGVLNRGGVEKHISAILKGPCVGSDEAVCALFIIDLDHFKDVNDNFGHPAGDAVLRIISQTIRQSVRDGDVVGRIGGDEFVVLLRDCPDKKVIEMRAGLLLQQVSRLSFEEHPSLRVSISMGIVCFPSLHNEAENYSALLARADAALYEVKRSGRNCWRFA